MQSYGNSIAHLSFLGKRKRGSISNVLRCTPTPSVVCGDSSPKGTPFCGSKPEHLCSLCQFLCGHVQRYLNDLVHVVVLILAQTTAEDHTRLGIGQRLVLRIQRAVLLVVDGIVGLVALFHSALYSRLMTVLGWVPNSKCLCSMMRV